MSPLHPMCPRGWLSQVAADVRGTHRLLVPARLPNALGDAHPLHVFALSLVLDGRS